MAHPHRLSLFSQRLDRVAHVAWFLGAVVPFGLVAGLVALEAPGLGARAPQVVTLVTAAAVLSLVSFALLRRMARQAVARMDEDALRLTTLLNASTALASAASGEDAASVAATYAARLLKARAAYVVARRSGSKKLAWSASAGAEAGAIFAAHAEILERLGTGVVAEGRPALRVRMPAGGGDWLAPTTVAVPFCTNNGMALAALIVVHGHDQGRFDERELDGLMTLAGLASVALTNVDLRRALSSQRVETLPLLGRRCADEDVASTVEEDEHVPAGVA